MAISKGYEGTIYAGSSVSDSEIAHINNWEINFSGDALENTAFGDGVYDRTYQPGLRAHTISFSGYSECYDYMGLSEIIEIFDRLSKFAPK